MRQVTLTQLDVSGIQDYVFGSNNLRQNVGASELVYRATTEWVDQILAEKNIRGKTIYKGGGNALLLFEGSPDAAAIPFSKALTRHVVRNARNLNLVVDHRTFDYEDKSLAEQHGKLLEQLRERKLARRQDQPLLGLGVTAACDFTGLPAVGVDSIEAGPRRLISESVRHKLIYTNPQKPPQAPSDWQSANDRLHKLLPQVKEAGFEFARDFDLFGEKGESSYIAVVHADGNRMGERFRAIAEEHTILRTQDDTYTELNNAYSAQLGNLSREVRTQSEAALQEVIGQLINSWDPETDLFGGVVPVPWKNGQRHLPFRPIVFGGDDTTFVCEGRLGLTLAHHFLKTLGQNELPGATAGQSGDRFYARAGVAVVKSHYPFSRAYELAESLAASAKESMRTRLPDPKKGIVIDWHFSTSGVILPLEEVRKREYRADNGYELWMRPVRIDLGDPPTQSSFWRSWDNFEKVVRAFKNNEDWKDKRNKVLTLREMLRRGEEAVQEFLQNFEQKKLPEIPTQKPMSNGGWAGEACGYFDPIEALDFFVPLEKGEVNE